MLTQTKLFPSDAFESDLKYLKKRQLSASKPTVLPILLQMTLLCSHSYVEW